LTVSDILIKIHSKYKRADVKLSPQHKLIKEQYEALAKEKNKTSIYIYIYIYITFISKSVWNVINYIQSIIFTMRIKSILYSIKES
jgi:hypothetical protein